MSPRTDTETGKVIQLPVGYAATRRRVLPKVGAGEVRLTHLRSLLERYVLPLHELGPDGYPVNLQALLDDIVGFLNRRVTGKSVVTFHTGLVLYVHIQEGDDAFTYGVTLDPCSFGGLDA